MSYSSVCNHARRTILLVAKSSEQAITVTRLVDAVQCLCFAHLNRRNYGSSSDASGPTVTNSSGWDTSGPGTFKFSSSGARGWPQAVATFEPIMMPRFGVWRLWPHPRRDFTCKLNAAPGPTAENPSPGPSPGIRVRDSTLNRITEWHIGPLALGRPGSLTSLMPAPQSPTGSALRSGPGPGRIRSQAAQPVGSVGQTRNPPDGPA